MISSRPIFGVMKLAAKSLMKQATRKAGLDWDAHALQMQQTAEVCRSGCVAAFNAGPRAHCGHRLSHLSQSYRSTVQAGK
jgi:hypothetical protein